MKFTGILLFVAFATGFAASAQDFKLGDVSKAELMEKVHPLDSSAAAAILFKKGKSYFEVDTDSNWGLVTEVEMRIKIYKKEGYDYATQEVGYYSGGKNVKVYFSKAYTYNLVDGKIEKTKLKSDGKFEDDVTDDVTLEKITMPDVKVGSVIEYKYVIKTPYFTSFRDWPFQYDIPVNYVEYEVAIPTYFEYNKYLTGYIPIDQSTPIKRSGVGSRFDEIAVTYSAKNVKAIKDEAFVDNIENYTSVLKYELASITPPSGTPKHFSDTWENVAKKIYDNQDFGRELNKDSYFEEDLDALLKTAPTGPDRLNTIFSYVQDRMNWNESNDFLCDKGVKKAYENKVGNTAEINLMLTAMLRHAGFNANPVLISTRSNGIALFPTRAAYNYVVAGVEVNGKTLLLDATSKYTMPGELPVRAINWVGRMIKENGTNAQIDLQQGDDSKEIIQISAKIDGDGKVTGMARDQYMNYDAYYFREKYAGMSEDSYLEKMEKNNKGLEINDYKVANKKELSKPVVEQYSFENSALSDVIGDKIYIDPMLYVKQDENPFKQEKREYPIDFIFPRHDKYMINIQIPEGYTVDFAPEPISLVMEQNIGSFRYNINATDNVVQLNIMLDINYPTISQDYYATLKNFFQKVIEKQNEKIILKKA